MALRRVRAMLRPGGLFRFWDVVYGFDPGEATSASRHGARPSGDEFEGDWARWEMEEHVRDEHSTFTWLLEAMFERTGFTVESPTTPTTVSTLVPPSDHDVALKVGQHQPRVAQNRLSAR